MKTVLFDLDGTLLPMDLNAFLHVYFQGLCSTIADIEPQLLKKSIYAGIDAMMRNDGKQTNRDAFGDVFARVSGLDFLQNENRFLEYYQNGFQNCVKACNTDAPSRELLDCLLAKGYRVGIATNPIFPKVATYSRLRWLGIDPEALELVTTYETSCFAKPNPDYYREVCACMGVEPSDCIMIGNDVEEDGCAAQLGMPVMLVTDCLLNLKSLPMDAFWSGTLSDVLQWAKDLPAAC